jgi:hypothetical protein
MSGSFTPFFECHVHVETLKVSTWTISFIKIA